MKHNPDTGRMVNPWFWRTYDQKELDFVEEGGGQFVGFAFKWGGGPTHGAKAFQAAYPGSPGAVIERGNLGDFAGVPAPTAWMN